MLGSRSGRLRHFRASVEPPNFEALDFARPTTVADVPLAGAQIPFGLSLRLKTSRATSAVSCAHRRSKSTSYGVNIRGAGEVTSLRLSKAIEGVAELLAPPALEVAPVLFSEFMKLLLRRIQSGRIGLARQPDRADHCATVVLNPTAQIRQVALGGCFNACPASRHDHRTTNSPRPK